MVICCGVWVSSIIEFQPWSIFSEEFNWFSETSSETGSIEESNSCELVVKRLVLLLFSCKTFLIQFKGTKLQLWPVSGSLRLWRQTKMTFFVLSYFWMHFMKLLLGQMKAQLRRGEKNASWDNVWGFGNLFTFKFYLGLTFTYLVFSMWFRMWIHQNFSFLIRFLNSGLTIIQTKGFMKLLKTLRRNVMRVKSFEEDRKEIVR